MFRHVEPNQQIYDQFALLFMFIQVKLQYYTSETPILLRCNSCTHIVFEMLCVAVYSQKKKCSCMLCVLAYRVSVTQSS